MSLEIELKKHIKKIVFPLKEGKELELALKAKLTKKEYKLLNALSTNTTQELKERLKLNNKSYQLLYDKLVKKLNQERIKQELYAK